MAAAHGYAIVQRTSAVEKVVRLERLAAVRTASALKAGEERNAEIDFLLRPIYQHADTDDFGVKFCYGRYYFADGAAGRQDIVDNQYPFTGVNVEAATEDSYIAFFLREDAADTELPSDLIGDNDAAGGGTGDHLHPVFFEVNRNHPA